MAVQEIKTPAYTDTSSIPSSPSRSDAHAVDLESLPDGYYRSKNFIGSLVAVAFMALSLYVGYNLPVYSLTAINADLGPDPNYTMISTVYTLLAGVGMLPVGRLGDIFGRRYFLIGGQILGLIGSAICATAKDIPTIIGGSVLCGFAAAVQLTFTFVICELVPNRLRPLVNAGLFIVVVPFGGFGAVIAQLFIAKTALSWRWNYYLTIICCAISIILYAFCYFPPGWEAKHRGQSRRSQMKHFDYIGFILYAGGLVLILLGLSWGGTSYPWSSAHVVSVLVVGFVTMTLFVLYELYGSVSQPLIPMKLLKNRGYSATVCSTLVANMVYFSLTLLWPQAVGYLYSTDAVEIGWLSITVGCGTIIGQIVGGLVLKPIGNTKYQLFASTVSITAFTGALAVIDQHKLAYGLAFTAIGGFAVGFVENLTIIMCPLYCRPEDIGLASGFLGSVKMIAGSLATAIYVAILNNRVAVVLPEEVSKAAVGAGLPESSLSALFEAITAGTTQAMQSVPDINTRIMVVVSDAVKTAYSLSFRTVFLVSIAFGSLSAIAALMSVSVDDKLNNVVAAKLAGTGASQESLRREENNVESGEKTRV